MNKQNVAIGGVVLAIVLSILALVGNQPAPVVKDQTQPPVEDQLGKRGTRYPGDICQGAIGSGDTLCKGSRALTFRRGTTLASTTAAVAQGSFQNDLNHDIWVRGTLYFEGEASSTVLFGMATSTAATVNAYTFFVEPKVLPTIEISTGTPPFAWSSQFEKGTTTQFDAAVSQATLGEATTTAYTKIQELFLGNREGAHGLGSWGWVRVKHGEYVVGLFTPLYKNCAAAGTGPSGNVSPNCESATSSNRGWDAFADIEYKYVASSSDAR